MMTSTAALQVNLDIGNDLDDGGPPLAAAARRRADDGRGLRQLPDARRGGHRLEVRPAAGLAAPRPRAHRDADRRRPRAAWTRLRPRRPPDAAPPRRHDWTSTPARRFRDWLTSRTADVEDLELHLTTLFPPVRPRGWFEVRYLDAQPWQWWPVPMAVLTALLDDPVALEVAAAACAGLDDWTAAARDGLGAPGLQDAALACFDAALSALTRMRRAPVPGGAGGRLPRPLRRAPAAARPTTQLDDTRRSHDPGPAPDRTCSTSDALKQYVADELERSRARSVGLTTAVLDEAELLAQHSRLMSPLVWDLAHVGNYEELWLLREAAGVEAMRPELDDIYDAFEHPRATRPTLPLLQPDEAGDYIGLVRRKVLDALDDDPPRPGRRRAARHGLRVRHGAAARAPARRDDAGHPPAAPRRPGVPRHRRAAGAGRR